MSLDERRRLGLSALDLGEVEFDVPLGPLTTLGIGGPVDVLVRVTTSEDLDRLKRWCRRERLPIAPVPSQPGLLVKDAGMRGVVVEPAEGAGPDVIEQVAGLDPKATQLELPTGVSAVSRLFLDPEGQRATDLIRDARLAGVRLRGARVSEEDPNLLVNEGEASARDVLALVDYIKRKVEKQSGLKLKEALRVLGRDRV